MVKATTESYMNGYEAGYFDGSSAAYFKYAPQHGRTYYVFRGFVRGLFWTAVITSFTAIAVASIWILWAVL